MSVDGIPLHVRRFDGVVEGRPPIVLVHGLAVSHRYLMPTAVALVQRGFDARVVDLPGFGLSERPAGYLDVREHADALAAWLDIWATGPVTMLGNSFGCQVLVDLVSRQPQRCRALVLSGPTMDRVGRTATRQVFRWCADLMLEDPFQLPITLRDVKDATLPRILATLRHGLRHSIEQQLPRLTVPTLVLRGSIEPIVPARWASEVTELIPDARKVDIPHTPHNCVYIAPDRLAAAVDAFLNEPARLT